MVQWVFCWLWTGIYLKSKYESQSPSPHPVGIYLFEVDGENTRTFCEICSKLIGKTQERHHWYCSDFLSLPLNRSHLLFWFFHCGLWTSKCRLSSPSMTWNKKSKWFLTSHLTIQNCHKGNKMESGVKTVGLNFILVEFIYAGLVTNWLSEIASAIMISTKE